MPTTIEEFVAERGIKSLCHFTQLSNLPSILMHGLLPREACGRAGIEPAINDPYRYDGTGAISATISYPNYKMFYRIRCGSSNAEWVLLELKASLLWRTRCAFSNTNAGDRSVFQVPLECRQGVVALQSMFDNYNAIERASLQIPDYYTTNPQAEILLLDGATVDDISCVYFQRGATYHQYSAQYPNRKFQLNGGFFDARRDYQHWK